MPLGARKIPGMEQHVATPKACLRLVELRAPRGQLEDDIERRSGPLHIVPGDGRHQREPPENVRLITVAGRRDLGPSEIAAFARAGPDGEGSVRAPAQ
jgi:hypothetical protein